MCAERKHRSPRRRAWGPLLAAALALSVLSVWLAVALVLLAWLGGTFRPAGDRPAASARAPSSERPVFEGESPAERGETSAFVSVPEPTGAKFEIYWPPRHPQQAREASIEPLLRSALDVEVTGSSGEDTVVRLAVTLWRPSAEADRQRWNRTLAFADLGWMDSVRVWDDEGRWLWPNLPSLLRLPGRERVERYGGMDPGKHVDNDFAAVLIREYDATGQVELPQTRDAPLVSAEWYARESPTDRDRHRIVHTARSEDFLIHVTPDLGRIKVWLIYADFLGAKPPLAWPDDDEWAGGILACWEIDVKATAAGRYQATARPEQPRQSTGFDWRRWAVRPSGSYETSAEARLSDRPIPSVRP